MRHNDTNRRKDETMATLTGRNGYEYDAKHLGNGFYIVGRFIVTQEDGKVDETICRATKANVAKYQAA